jgi:DNA replication and repair protein RecF
LKLTRFKITNFKSYEYCDVSFDTSITTLVGNNGMGKTNLLDAIYYLCIGKSYFTSSDKNVVKYDADFIRLEAYVDDIKIVNKNLIGKEKNIEIDDILLEKMTDFVGQFPVVVIAPKDIQELIETSEERRIFVNNSLVQYHKGYLFHLMHYNRLLKQRNALLKSSLEQKSLDHTLLDIITQQMKPHSNEIHLARLNFYEAIKPIFIKNYTDINQSAEFFDLQYESDLSNRSFDEAFHESRAKDIMTGRTNKGIHKDDLIFTINNRKLKDFGSQGQIKSYILALKLSQYHLIKKFSNKLPFLLLDDIFDKLDNLRVDHLLKMINDGHFGQIFITDANKHRVNDLLDKYGIKYTGYWVENGKLSVI